MKPPPRYPACAPQNKTSHPASPPPLAGHLLRVTALDLSTLHGKTAEAQLKAFEESLKPDRPDV